MKHAKNYQQLAETLANNLNDESALISDIAALPKLDEPLLEFLAAESEKESNHHPKTGWAIARIANLAADQQSEDLWLQSLSSWYLARAANRWVRPALASSALRHARRGFKKLNESAWLAACDWQSAELAWVKGNIVQSVQTLRKASAVLDEANLRDFAIQCCLSYANMQLYINEIAEARANFARCEKYFSLHDDESGLAQCAYFNSLILRWQNQGEKATKELEYATEIFTRLDKKPFLAKTYFQLGIVSLFTTTDIEQTKSYFEQADDLFIQCDLDIWHGYCQSYLGITVLQDGHLSQSECCFDNAKTIFSHFHTPYLLANNYTASGLFHLAKGEPQKSITEFQSAQRLHKRAGEVMNASVDSINLGKTYLSMGRYQDALFMLEKATETIKSHQNVVTIADCELNIASAWVSLHNFHLALEHLKVAEGLYSTHQQNGSLTTANNLKARIYFEMNDLDGALACLEESLERSNKFHLRSQKALAHRLIGQLLVRKGDFASAIEHLRASLRSFSEMQMGFEEANCLLSLGNYYNATGKLNKAEKHYSAALDQSDRVFDEINWPAYAGLAKIAEKAGNPLDALKNYQQSIASLNRIRSNFWQAELAGSYAHRPSEVFFNAITLATKLNSTENIFAFIEADKAISLSNQLFTKTSSQKNSTSHAIEELKSEITWLQDQMRVSTHPQNGIKSALQTRQFRQKLIEKSQEYAELNSELQRKAGKKRSGILNDTLTPDEIRTSFNHLIGIKWAAVDYYLQEDQLFLLLLTPNHCVSLQATVSAQAKLALETSLRSQQNGQIPDQNDLQTLGELLMPPEVRELLQPETYLILSPHGELHGLPWNALAVGTESQPLVEQAIPVIVPSLRSAIELWKPQSGIKTIPRQRGLAVGISEFSEKFSALPFVDRELADFTPILANDGVILRNEQASWQALLQITNSGAKKGLSQFSFLHLASHFFSDSASGELSGVALWGENIYQDQLRTLAPLPELVTLSGCSSIFSRTYAGDEHVGLPTTCLIAGAKSILGSNWPVLDNTAAEFMSVFYQNYFKGLGPATALAQSQREFIRSHKDMVSWAGYCCIGKP